MAEDDAKDEKLKRRKHRYKGLIPIKKKIFRKKRKPENDPPPPIPGGSLRRVALLLGVYLTIGTIIFYLARDHMTGKKTNGIVDSVYFCVVTMTTVGYGDIIPETDLAKLLACVFVLVGMGLGGFALSKAADYIVEKELNMFVQAIQIHETSENQHLIKEASDESFKVKYKFLTILSFIFFLVAVGIVFLILVEDMSIIDAFYCVVVTITTLGYGDKSFSSEAGRLFAIVWILTSTISVAQFFAYLVEIWTDRKQKQLVDWVLSRKMTVQDIEQADLDNDDSVSPAEYVVYKLKEMGLVNDQLIMSVMEGFKTLDVDNSGTLTTEDLSNASKRVK